MFLNIIKKSSHVRYNVLNYVTNHGLPTDTNRKSITGNEKIDKNIDNMTNGKIFDWISTYEEIIGLSEVKVAQTNVLDAERKFLEKQTERIIKSQELEEMQSRLNIITSELDKVKKGDEGYLSIIKDEYDIIKMKRILSREHKDLEILEQKSFSFLSSSLRESHEKERSRTEKIKYWSLVGSIIGASIGVLGTSVNNYHRMKVIKGIVSDSVEDTNQMRDLVHILSKSVTEQKIQFEEFVASSKVTEMDNRGGEGECSSSDTISPIRTQEVKHVDDVRFDKYATRTRDFVKDEINALRKDMKHEFDNLVISISNLNHKSDEKSLHLNDKDASVCESSELNPENAVVTEENIKIISKNNPIYSLFYRFCLFVKLQLTKIIVYIATILNMVPL